MEKLTKIFEQHPAVNSLWLDKITGEVYFNRQTAACVEYTRIEVHLRNKKNKK